MKSENLCGASRRCSAEDATKGRSAKVALSHPCALLILGCPGASVVPPKATTGLLNIISLALGATPSPGILAPALLPAGGSTALLSQPNVTPMLGEFYPRELQGIHGCYMPLLWYIKGESLPSFRTCWCCGMHAVLSSDIPKPSSLHLFFSLSPLFRSLRLLFIAQLLFLGVVLADLIWNEFENWFYTMLDGDHTIDSHVEGTRICCFCGSAICAMWMPI